MMITVAHFAGDDPAFGKPSAPTTVVIPTHPARGQIGDRTSLLGRAVASVRGQTVQPAGGIVVAFDHQGAGAARTRQAGLDAVETEFVSFLDSDDWFYPGHLAAHMALLAAGGATHLGEWADVAYSWFDGNNPFPMHRGRVFDPREPHHLTMTLTVRTALAKRVGFLDHQDAPPSWSGEDWHMILGLRDLGARFVGTGEVTWHYAVHGGNTSGRPDQGDGPIGRS